MLKKACPILIFILFLFFPSKLLAAEQDLIVNEIMYDLPGSDTGREWVEVVNIGGEQVTIIGGSGTGSWRINDGANRTFSSTATQGDLTIPPGGFAVITQDAGIFLSDYPGFTGTLIQSSTLSLNNTAAIVGLRIGSSGALWGEFSYQSGLGGSGDGNSLQKTSDGSIIAALSTPGSTNATVPVPTPTLTPTSTPTPTPTKVPTPTKTPTVTKSPTATKTLSTSTNADNSKESVTPTSINRRKNNSINIISTPNTRQEVAGISDEKDKGNEKTTIEDDEQTPAYLYSVTTGLGMIILACVILLYRKFKTKNEEEDF